jgi:hypothetical protein
VSSEKDGAEVGIEVGIEEGLEEGSEVGRQVRSCPAMRGAQVGTTVGLIGSPKM